MELKKNIKKEKKLVQCIVNIGGTKSLHMHDTVDATMEI